MFQPSPWKINVELQSLNPLGSTQPRHMTPPRPSWCPDNVGGRDCFVCVCVCVFKKSEIYQMYCISNASWSSTCSLLFYPLSLNSPKWKILLAIDKGFGGYGCTDRRGEGQAGGGGERSSSSPGAGAGGWAPALSICWDPTFCIPPNPFYKCAPLFQYNQLWDSLLFILPRTT